MSAKSQFGEIVAAAVAAGASDIHLKAGHPVAFRMGRELRNLEYPAPTEQWIDELLLELLPAGMRQQWDEQHEVDFSYESEGIGRLRGNIFRERGRVVCAFRLVKAAIRSLAELRLPDSLAPLLEQQVGLIVIAGATGTGKSTTLAAMIEHINQRQCKHIIALEDPIEFVFTDQLARIEQREIGIDTRSFAAGLKHVLRQDPDVIAIGELRDAESFAAALRAVNTGHLVLTTLHASGAAQTITRALEFFPGNLHEQVRRQLSAALSAVLCQKLVTQVDGTLTPATELLVGNLTVRKLIEAGTLETLPQAMTVGSDDGMHTFNQSLLKLVKENRITQAEALAQSPQPESLRMNFQGIVIEAGAKRILGGGLR